MSTQVLLIYSKNRIISTIAPFVETLSSNAFDRKIRLDSLYLRAIEALIPPPTTIYNTLTYCSLKVRNYTMKMTLVIATKIQKEEKYIYNNN